MRKLAVAALAWLAAFCAHAQLSIEITGAGANRIPIAIVPFAGEGALPMAAPSSPGSGVTGIVRADLERSGLFRSLELPPLVPQPTESSPVNFAEWKARLADALAVYARCRIERSALTHDTELPVYSHRFPPDGVEHLNRKIVSRVDDIFDIIGASNKSFEHVKRAYRIAREVGIQFDLFLHCWRKPDATGIYPGGT